MHDFAVIYFQILATWQLYWFFVTAHFVVLCCADVLWCCVVLCCVVLMCCVVLHCVVLHCVVLWCFVLLCCVVLCWCVVLCNNTDSHFHQPLYTLLVCDCTVSLALITSMGCVRTVAKTPAKAPAPILQTALRLLDLPSSGKCYKEWCSTLEVVSQPFIWVIQTQSIGSNHDLPVW